MKSIPILSYEYFCIHFAIFMVYGFKKSLFGFVFCGFVLGLMNILVLRAIRIVGRIESSRILLSNALIYFGCTVMFASEPPFSYYLISGIYCAGTVSLWLMPIGALWKGIVGTLSMKLLLSVAVSIGFWTVFGHAIHDRLLFWNCVASLVAVMLTMYLWYTERLQRITNETGVSPERI